MKKIILFSLFIASVAMTSCTADSASDSNPKTANVSQDDTGGQNGGLTTPPPRP